MAPLNEIATILDVMMAPRPAADPGHRQLSRDLSHTLTALIRCFAAT